jgi:glycosyltransferase involved in cell wall biosynthesis
MKIFHMLPNNTSPCGGLYVHYQFCEEERSLGHDSYIVFPDDMKYPHIAWFVHSCKEITVSGMVDVLRTTTGDQVLLIGWEDIDCMTQFDEHSIRKVAFIQNQIYFKGSDYYLRRGADLWFPSTWVRDFLEQEGECIPQYIDRGVFHSPFMEWRGSTQKFEYSVMVQSRKEGAKRVAELTSAIPECYRSCLNFDIVPDIPQQYFADALRAHDLFFAHSFPEGLPLTPMEAMECGTVVFGYTGGGGAYYMEHGKNCILAPDGDYEQLAKNLSDRHEGILGDATINLARFKDNALMATAQFNYRNTRELLAKALEKYLK